jgi:hypothetical protein
MAADGHDFTARQPTIAPLGDPTRHTPEPLVATPGGFQYWVGAPGADPSGSSII